MKSIKCKNCKREFTPKNGEEYGPECINKILLKDFKDLDNQKIELDVENLMNDQVRELLNTEDMPDIEDNDIFSLEKNMTTEEALDAFENWTPEGFSKKNKNDIKDIYNLSKQNKLTVQKLIQYMKNGDSMTVNFSIDIFVHKYADKLNSNILPALTNGCLLALASNVKTNREFLTALTNYKIENIANNAKKTLKTKSIMESL